MKAGLEAHEEFFILHWSLYKRFDLRAVSADFPSDSERDSPLLTQLLKGEQLACQSNNPFPGAGIVPSIHFPLLIHVKVISYPPSE